MGTQQPKKLILKELSTLMQQDSGWREWVLNIGRTQFADKAVTNSQFAHQSSTLIKNSKCFKSLVLGGVRLKSRRVE